jgi:protease-4
MSATSESTPVPAPEPGRLSPPAPGGQIGHERSLLGSLGAGLMRLVNALSSIVKLALLVLFLFLLVAALSVFSRSASQEGPKESFYTGNRSARAKIAIIRIEGMLMEGLNGFAQKQIDAAAADPAVKAVVVRINSPGGTITASDNLHRRLNELRQGKNQKHPGTAKPLVVSMSSIAASGGYYIAMIKSDPPTPVLAEPTTITGSIGVYAAFPNVKKLADDNGVHLDYVRAGDIKASGSPFRVMTDHEKEVWQNMVDHAYLHFLKVIEEARSPLLTRDILQEDVTVRETLHVRNGPDKEKRLNYKRYRADGGIFTAAQAQKLKLIDKIGYLSDAIEEARRLADLGPDCQVITYDRPTTLLGLLMGEQASKPALLLDADRLSAATAPRLWYLAPQHEMAGFLATLGR